MKPLGAEPVPVRHPQGTFHGFLALKTLEGKTIAVGDLIQVVDGKHMKSRLVFHFRDGSLDDETAIFTQHKSLELISDHHVERGPSFPKPLDMFLDVAAGKVTSRDEHGAIVEEHFDLTPDLCNGLIIPLLLNLNPAAPPVRLPMMAGTPKPRLVHVLFMPEGKEQFLIGGVRREATNYCLRFELGGIAGVVAPILGKQPADIHVLVLDGEAPALVRGEGQFYENGPIWRIEIIAPAFPRAH